MQDVFNKCSLFICRSAEAALKCTRNLFFKNWSIIDEDCVFFYGKKRVVKMDRPIAVGFSVLDISKCKMFSLYYDEIKSRFPTSTLCASDTDSFFVTNPDVSKNEFLSTLKEHIDFSNYPSSHPLFSMDNHRVPGKLKDENKYVNHIVEMVALRSKVYSYRTISGSEEKRAKGVTKAVVKRDFNIALYRGCLKRNERIYVESSRLQPKKLVMQLIRQRKLALSATDCKMYTSFCGVHNLTYNHYRLRDKSQYKSCHVCGVTEDEMWDNLMEDYANSAELDASVCE